MKTLVLILTNHQAMKLLQIAKFHADNAERRKTIQNFASATETLSSGSSKNSGNTSFINCTDFNANLFIYLFIYLYFI